MKKKNGKLILLNIYMKMTKRALIKAIIVKLEDLPQKSLAHLAYNLTKLQLPALRTKMQRVELQWEKENPKMHTVLEEYERKRKTKRRFSKKQLAAQRLFAKRARAGTLRRRKR